MSDIEYFIQIGVPTSIGEDYGVTMHLQIEMISIEDSGLDQYILNSKILDTKNTQTFTRAFTPPKYVTELRVQRKVPKDYVKTLNLKSMPGFKIKWSFTGYDYPQAHYSSSYNTRFFTRCYSIKYNILS